MELFRSAILRKRGSGASQLAPSCPQTSPARPIFLCCLWHGLKDLLRFCFAFNPPRAELCPLGGVPCLVGGGRGRGQRPHPACLVPRSRSASRLKSPPATSLPWKMPPAFCCPLPGAVAGTQRRSPPLRYGDQPLAFPCLRQAPAPKPGGTVAVVPRGSFPSPRQGFGLGDGQVKSQFPRLLLCPFYRPPHF